MSRQENKCPKCGKFVDENSNVCDFCQTNLQSSKFVDDNGEMLEQKELDKKYFKERNGRFVKIAIAIGICVLIIKLVYTIYSSVFSKVEKLETEDIWEAIEVHENYTPGELTSDGYTSEFWNIRFTPSSDWYSYEKSELVQMSEDSLNVYRDSFVTEYRKSGKIQNLTPEIEEELRQSCYVNYEFYVDFGTSDFESEGVAYCYTLSAYGSEMVDAATFLAELNDSNPDISKGTISTMEIAGNEYAYCCSYNKSTGGYNSMYVRKKDGMFLIINIAFFSSSSDNENEFIECIDVLY
ncbi:MAG: hypothetical protein II998_02645 [Clostridia bacterium]|nr:hypothetical protein [Clostridia bacterium]